MPEQSQTSVPQQGMVTDINSINLKENQYPYAMNASVESNSQDGNFFSLQNEGSNLLAVNFPVGFQVIGKRPIPEQNRTIYFLVHPDSGMSEIGEVIECQYSDDTSDALSSVPCATCDFPYMVGSTPLEKITQTPYCQYHSIIQAACLNFSMDYPVRAEYSIRDCELRIYFTDNLNQRRYLYFDYQDGNQRANLLIQDRFKNITGYTAPDCITPIFGSTLDCNKLAYHPVFKFPCVSSIEFVSGGSCKAGTVQFLIAYTDKDANPLTNYFPSTNPLPIFSKYLTFETNYQTDKAVKIELQDIDQTNLYSYYTVVVAETVDNFTTMKLVGTFPVTQSTVVYTGSSPDYKELTAQEVFARHVFYKKAANVTSANDYLFFSNLAEWNKPNLQRVANKIKLYWETVAIPEAVYREGRNSEKFRGLQRDEVYAYAAVFVTENGEELGSYHIPGPSKELFLQYGIDVDAPIDNNDVIKDLECGRNCCEAPSALAFDGTMTWSCNDNGCSVQGATILNLTFTQPTPFDITINFAEIHTGQTGSFITGWDIVPNGLIPVGTNHDTYFGSGTPLVVTIPAGSTSYSVTHIPPLVNSFPPGVTAESVCHSCLFPFTHFYIKTVAPTNFQLNLTSTQVAITTLPTEFDDPDPDPTCEDCNNTPSWQTYNNAFVIGTPHEVLDHCDDDKIWEWGEFAYWQSIRKYPNDPIVWGELCGKPIRHHKMPDSVVTHIHDGKDASKGFNDSNIIYPLGIRLDHQSVIDAFTAMVTAGVISAADRDRIKSYYIVRGNRSGRKSVVAKGMVYDMWSYPKNSRTYYYPNFPYNDLRANRLISNSESTYQGNNTSGPTVSNFAPSGRYTFHSPDTHFNNPELGTILKLEVNEYGRSEGFFNHCEDEAEYKFLSTAAMTLAFAAGVAAAFSANAEKECVQYTVKSSSTEVSPVGGQTTWSEQVFIPWGKNTGQIDPSGLKLVETVTRTTCRGSQYQLLNPLSLSVVGFFFQQAIYKGVLSIREIQIMIDLIKALIPSKNFAIQWNSVGRYMNYKVVPNNTGNKIRAIKRSAYLEPKFQIVDDAINVASDQFTHVHINNWNRESSVYVKIDNQKLLPSPSKVDTSRFTMNQIGQQQEDLGRIYQTDISSYYASIKNYVPDQYGFINDVEYVSTGGCGFSLLQNYTISQTGVFGGDTFINRFALKRKHPFFLQSRFRHADQSDVRYSELGNAGYPNYYFNTEEALFERLSGNAFGGFNIMAFVQDLIGVANTRLDARKNKMFYQSGYIHLYSHGIPYFFCESDVNVDYRYAQNTKERDFYPHQQDLHYWLQEKNVPISEDNYYFYNRTYSKQNKETVLAPQVMSVSDECKFTYPSTAIQSEQGFYDSKVDKWLIFKANTRANFASSNGAIIGLDGLENDKVLVRFENGTKILSAYDTLRTELNEIEVGTTGVFSSRAKDFATTSLGYAGTQHVDLLQTEFGHIWVDAKRGNVFNLGPAASGLDELAKDGMKNWFKENLPFQVLKDFPNMPVSHIDNNFKGLGVHFSFDKRFNRFFITKLDYKKTGNITYNPELRIFSTYPIIENVELGDPRYFCNKSWTISYNFATKSWTSFYSFTPNFYVDQVDYIESGINGAQSSLWTHNLNNKSYQVYYGKLKPFIVEVSSNPMMLNGVLNSASFMVDTLRYQNSQDYAYNREICFNKAIVYNDQQTSGLLSLNVRNESNLHQSISYPKYENGAQQILVTRDRDLWNFNQFWDVVNFQPSNLPLFINKCSNCEKDLNLAALNYFKPDSLKQKIRGAQTKIRLINDQHSNYKFVFHFLTQQKEPS